MVLYFKSIGKEDGRSKALMTGKKNKENDIFLVSLVIFLLLFISTGLIEKYSNAVA